MSLTTPRSAIRESTQALTLFIMLSGSQIEYDLVVAPGADPTKIELQIQGVESLSLDNEGHLQLQTSLGEVLQHRPVIYQIQNGQKTYVPGSYTLKKDNRVTFNIGEYDSTRRLFIDPVLSYSTYFSSDGVRSLALDGNGNIYLTGAAGPTFQTANPITEQSSGLSRCLYIKAQS